MLDAPAKPDQDTDGQTAPKVSFVSLGCPKALVDSERIITRLRAEGYELTRDIPLTTERIETPLQPMDAPVILGKKLAVVPVLRAGLGMSAGLLELVPSAREGHIGLYRDHDTKQPHEYLVKLPPAEGRLFIVVDPMLATGNSAAHACDVLNRHGVDDHNIRFMALVAAPEGVRRFHESHADVKVFTAALDSHLNEDAYIVPGLGDAGDRMFGTK